MVMSIGAILLAAVGIILLIVLGILIWVIGSYNGFVKLRNKTEEAFSALDISLKKRYDLIPNYVETVKGYAKYESETLERVIQARNRAMNAALKRTMYFREVSTHCSHFPKTIRI